jgi:single-stranded-DNA-specific exonuclease
MNRQRREVDEETTLEAIYKLDKYSETMYCNVVWGKDWHRGVVGIVASRLVEHRYRPTVVLSEENGMLLGSARSVHGVDIHKALESCSDLLDQYGGHPMAAGLSLSKNNLLAFEERLEEVLCDQLDQKEPVPAIKYDMETSIDRLTDEAHMQLQQLEPYGPGNPTPVFMLSNVVCTKPPRTVGAKKQHLKLSLASPENPHQVIEAVGFNLGHQLANVRKWRNIDVTFTLTRNTWRDRGWQPRSELNLHLRALRASHQAHNERSDGGSAWSVEEDNASRNGFVTG